MKILSLFLFVIHIGAFCLSTKAFAQAHSTDRKWVTENFNSLSVNDKKKFIQDLREVIVLIDEKSDFFAEHLNLKTGTFSSLAQLILFQQCEAAAATPEDSYVGLANEKMKFYKTNSFTEASSMALKEFKEQVKSNGGRDLTESQGQMANAAAMLLIGEAKQLENSSDEKRKKDLENKFNELMKELSGYKVPDSTRKTMNGVEAVFYKISKITKPEEVATPKPQPQDKKDKSEKKEKKSVVVKKGLSEDEIKKIESEYSFSACLYAGFLIQEKVCKAPKTLPKNEALNSLFDEKTFKCESSEEVICNPILFGYEGDCNLLGPTPKTSAEVVTMMEKDRLTSKTQKNEELKTCLKTAKPVCAPNSMSVTASCKEKTKNSNYLSHAVDLISANPQILQDYIKGFDQLCDEKNYSKNRLIYRKANGELRKNSESIKDDIDKTCKVAKPKLDEVVNEYHRRALASISGAPSTAPAAAASAVKK